MKKEKLDNIAVGLKFAYKNKIYTKLDHSFTYVNGISLCYVYSEDFELCEFEKTIEVNRDWWEALENPTKIEIMEAYEDGAEIEYKVNCQYNQNRWIGCPYPTWSWTQYEYRIKPFEYELKTTHTITIDEKEIEISEESYNSLKKSLK